MYRIISHDSETPAKGMQVFTACAFIHAKFDGVSKVFLPRRANTKKFLPGVFELPGGHIEYGEDMVEGLKREIREEFEMEVSIGDPFYCFTYLNEVKGSHSVEVIYFAEFTGSLEDIKIHPEDHSEYKWIAENDLSQIISNNKGSEDLEFKALIKGFELLNGGTPKLS